MQQGWAPVMHNALADMALQAHGSAKMSNIAARYSQTWSELRQSATIQQLVPLAVQHIKLLHAVDTFPRGAVTVYAPA